MWWPFRRRRGRHQLGAAVTAIPSGPVRLTPPAPEPPPAPQPAPAPAAEPEPQPQPQPQPAVEVEPGPRVELGFRDGTTAALAPGSAQAKALTEIASLLTQRDQAG